MPTHASDWKKTQCSPIEQDSEMTIASLVSRVNTCYRSPGLGGVNSSACVFVGVRSWLLNFLARNRGVISDLFFQAGSKNTGPRNGVCLPVRENRLISFRADDSYRNSFVSAGLFCLISKLFCLPQARNGFTRAATTDHLVEQAERSATDEFTALEQMLAKSGTNVPDLSKAIEDFDGFRTRLRSK